MIASYATATGVRHALERVRLGAERSGRRLEDLELFVRVETCLSDDPGAAREASRPLVAMRLGSSYPDRGFVHAVGLEAPPAFRSDCRPAQPRAQRRRRSPDPRRAGRSL